MSRSRLLPALALALMLVTAGCAGLATSQPAAQAEQATTGDSTIRVATSGQVEAQPDQAILRISVVATGDSANAVREAVAANASAMRQALREAGVSDDQIRTAYYDISRAHRERKTGAGQYRAIHAFRITVSDTSRVGELIDVAVTNGADRVDGVQFTLSEEKRRELRKDALREAMTNARSQADVLASAANLTITEATRVQTGHVQVRPYRVQYESARAVSASTSVESGPVTVTAQVVVTYNATAD